MVVSRTSLDAASVVRAEVAVAAAIVAAATVVSESAAEMRATRRPFIVADRDNNPIEGMKYY